MKSKYKPIVGALIFSVLLIASAYFLKKNPLREWVDSIIYMASAYFWFWYFTFSRRSSRSCGR